MFDAAPQGGAVSTHHARENGGQGMKKGYEGIVVAVWMLFVAWTLIAVAKFLF